jgi:hypothetical protein
MFQYAAGLALAERHRCALKLDLSWFREFQLKEAHNRYALSCLNITEQFATDDEVERLRRPPLGRRGRVSLALLKKIAEGLGCHNYARHIHLPGRHHVQPGFRYYPDFLKLEDHTYVDGLFQSEQFFAPVADLLRLHFTFRYPATPAVEHMAAQIRSSASSAAVHFRRGDYVTNPTYSKQMGVVDMDYYHRAVRLLRERHPGLRLYIFSDDIDTIEREFKPGGENIFVRCTQPWNAYDKIRLMSLCHHAIIANSTFSWWAAWLNPAPGKTVIAPTPWFASNKFDESDLFPKSWMQLSAHSPVPENQRPILSGNLTQ